MSNLTAAQSKYNPFRSNPSTPNVTGSSGSPSFPQPQLGGQGQANASGLASPSAGAAETHLTPPPAFSASPGLPTRSGPIATAPINDVNNSRSPIPPEEPDLPDLPGEEPPPYTPRPSAFSGETTVEQGPVRPFQPPPPRPANSTSNSTSRIQNNGPIPAAFPPPTQSPSRSGGGGILQQITGTISQVIDEFSSALNPPSASTREGGRYQWSSYPGQQPQSQSQTYRPPPGPPPPSQPQSQTYRAPSGPPPSNNAFRPGLEPPPRHPSLRSQTRTPSPGMDPLSHSPSPSSDFTRDFYAAGTGEGLNLLENGTHSGPPAASTSRRPASMGDLGASSGSSKGNGNNNNVPDDGRPTSYPAVGHPLLRDGKLLIYPVGYECEKCHNVGYKNADPDKPCKKCWNKYSKPFSGPLAYSFSSSTSASSNTASNFQRPLPSLPAPSAQGRRLHHSHTNHNHHEHNHHNRNTSYPPSPGPPPMPGAFPLGSGGPDNFSRGIHDRFNRPGINPSGFGSGSFGDRTAPPPSSVVYTPGDPRIGGMLCWRCDGKGSTSFLLLDRVMCPVCGGVGRTFG